MGKQVNFFMLEQDEVEFHDRIRDLDGSIILYRSPEPFPVLCTRLPTPESGPNWTEFCIVQNSRISEVRLGSEPVLGRFLVDEEGSPVIQFHRSWRSDTLLRRGRIWAEMRARYPEARSKGPDFAQFFQRIASWLRRNYLRDPDTRFLVGKAAWEWYLAGGKLTQL